jgi:ABC-2 type transport system permease protein
VRKRTTYLRYELVRTLRNKRFFLLSLAMPLLIYLLVAAPNRTDRSLAGTGISLRLYFMVALASFGSMNAMLGTGVRIAVERTAGWNRQLRLTPLSTREYFGTKVLTGYMVSGCTIALLYVAGGGLGVHIPAGDWVRMTLLLIVGLVPFAALGILIGHLITADAVAPAIGGITALLSFLGGVWFPVGDTGVLHYVAQELPSYWLVQASYVGVGGHSWSSRGWIVMAAWTVIAARLAMRAYARDTGRG